MKNIYRPFLLLLFTAFLFASCKKDLEKSVLTVPAAGLPGFTSSASTLVLSEATDGVNVVTFRFSAPDYGIKVVPSYTLQFDVPADTSGATAWEKAIDVQLSSDSLQKAFSGADFNALLALQLMLPTGENSTLVVRLKSEVKQNNGVSSTVKPLYSSLTMTVNPYKAVVVYPALMVKGADSWKTPTERSNGYVLTSAKFNSKYEGYLTLPNTNRWGGDSFTLVDTKDNKVYGWGKDANTLSLDGGPLWLTPAPNYMKVNVDLDALTINYTPVKFYVTGDDNGWSTSATPMKYNAGTQQWVAENVALTAGKAFAFTCNNSYDISYKLDKENGVLAFTGKPTWGGVNIPVAKTGLFTVVLDLSAGDGNYTYSVK